MRTAIEHLNTEYVRARAISTNFISRSGMLRFGRAAKKDSYCSIACALIGSGLYQGFCRGYITRRSGLAGVKTVTRFQAKRHDVGIQVGTAKEQNDHSDSIL